MFEIVQKIDIKIMTKFEYKIKRNEKNLFCKNEFGKCKMNFKIIKIKNRFFSKFFCVNCHMNANVNSTKRFLMIFSL